MCDLLGFLRRLSLRAISFALVLAVVFSSRTFADPPRQDLATRGHAKKVAGAIMIAAGSAFFVVGAASLGLPIAAGSLSRQSGGTDSGPPYAPIGLALLASSLIVPVGIVLYTIGGEQMNRAKQLGSGLSVTPMIARQGVAGAIASFSLPF